MQSPRERRSRCLRAFIATAALVSLCLTGASASAIHTRGEPSVSLRPSVHVIDATSAQRARLEEALGRFGAVGLMLPDLVVRFSEGEGPCDGHLGLFRRTAPRWTITICTDLPFVYEHEVAHAWEAANITDDERAHYLLLRGLEVWRDKTEPWSERGVEDAAFVLQQGLLSSPVVRASAEMCSRLEAFRFLTGVDSPRADSRLCR